MDNRIFNVNGSGTDMLRKTLELVFLQDGRSTTCKAWKQTIEHGLILYWSETASGGNPLPSAMSAEQCVTLVEGWLADEFALDVERSRLCEDAGHDGHNTDGWQVYCEDMGRIDDNPYAICAIKPASMWHGK